MILGKERRTPIMKSYIEHEMTLSDGSVKSLYVIKIYVLRQFVRVEL